MRPDGLQIHPGRGDGWLWSCRYCDGKKRGKKRAASKAEAFAAWDEHKMQPGHDAKRQTYEHDQALLAGVFDALGGTP